MRRPRRDAGEAFAYHLFVSCQTLQLTLGPCIWCGRLLEKHFDEEVDKIVIPIQKELTRMSGLLQKANLEREEDRRDIASLWPPEHLMPSLLLKYKVCHNACCCQVRG